MSRVRFPRNTRLPHEAYSNPEAVFHLVLRAAVGTQPFAGAACGDAVWRLVDGERNRGAVTVHAACLMPDHLHLVVTPGNRSIIEWVDSFKSYSTRVAWNHLRGLLWQPGFYDRRIRDEREFEATLVYIESNPAEAGLVRHGTVWPWMGIWVER